MGLLTGREGFPPDFTTEAVATLAVDGKQYVVRTWYPADHEDDWIEFHWTEGNYSCDDNRSMFIHGQCNPEFERLDCGDTIELVDLKIVRHPAMPVGG